MHIRSRFAIAETVLDKFRPDLGADFEAYRNHIRRVLNFYSALDPAGSDPSEAVQLAAAFHDLGIWTDDTFDYLAPSVKRARAHLDSSGQLPLFPEVSLLIAGHHKIRPYLGEFALPVERFRRADFVDLSLGLLRFGLPASFVREVRAAFPNAGFHGRLASLTLKQAARNPLRPLPMFRW